MIFLFSSEKSRYRRIGYNFNVMRKSASASRRLAETTEPPKIEVVTVAYHIQFCHFVPSYWFIQLQICFDKRNVDTLISKIHSGKVSEICDFGIKHDFLPKNVFRLKCCP